MHELHTIFPLMSLADFFERRFPHLSQFIEVS
jgi:hypothetical protein